MEIIDMEHWDRKEHFHYFRGQDYPQFNICANIDITKFLKSVKSNGLPLYYAMIFAAASAANKVKNFRYRIRNDGVILHDKLNPSFTAMEKDTDLFKYVMVELGGDIFAFSAAAKGAADQQKGLFVNAKDYSDERDDLVYLTCIPWISFTHISHTITLDKNDSIPRIAWGKYFSDGAKTLLPLSVQVNHALADGVHIGKYFSELQAYIDAF